MSKHQNANKPLFQVNRVCVKGKFLFLGEHKFYIKGSTYGTFAPDENEQQFPPAEIVAKDFALMAQHGFNSVRTYTVPPKYLLDLALEYDLKVMVGLPWEQHITFLDTAAQKVDILKRVKEAVLSCGQHQAILCFTIGNEIPAPMVRWYGRKKIEKFLKQLYHAVKTADPESLVTYVNYPTTEYLNLSFLDFDCFNVYLETPEKLSAYIARLHNLSGNRPLVLAEIGLDSQRNGEEKQAEILQWQVQTCFGSGCAGMFVFAWTDEWWRGGFEIEDWDFGLVDRQRKPKLALLAVAETMQAMPFISDKMPLISVVVCSYNGAATIRDCMEGLQMLEYPNFEVIVVNDGSRDNLADIVNEYPVQLITTPNRGLSSARNTGMYAAKGEIVAYIDDDAYPDPHWLQYLAYAYANSKHDCIGGPNIAPYNDGRIATCVANAPGGPVHVLLSDEIAEHVPGCNMSFRRSALISIGGFDTVFRSAGDDVDVCWRIQDTGATVGFHPGAVVWHHRRNSFKAYWKQQKGYGKAEALLEQKWPEKYNSFGHLAWAGRIYGNGCTLPIQLQKGKVFHGTWGTALFQSVYSPAAGMVNAFPLMPEWYLFIALITITSLSGFFWPVLFWAIPFLIAAITIVVAQAVTSSFKNAHLPPQVKGHTRLRVMIICMHLIQPVARLYGRLKHGLSPWKKRKEALTWKWIFTPFATVHTYWSEKWMGTEDWLQLIEQNLMEEKLRVTRGGDFDRWDLQTRNGISSVNRALLTIEEHGAGKQFVRMKTWAKPSKLFIISFFTLGGLACFAAVDGALIVASVFSFFAALSVVEYVRESSMAVHYFATTLKHAGNNVNAVTETIKMLVHEKVEREKLNPLHVKLTRRNDLHSVKDDGDLELAEVAK